MTRGQRIELWLLSFFGWMGGNLIWGILRHAWFFVHNHFHIVIK